MNMGRAAGDAAHAKPVLSNIASLTRMALTAFAKGWLFLSSVKTVNPGQTQVCAGVCL